MNDVFNETDTPIIHPALDPEPEVQSTGWVAMSTYLESVKSLTAEKRTLRQRIRAVGAVCFVSAVCNVVLLILWVCQ